MKAKGEMKVLNLIIKQQWFDAILSGEKTQEFREIRPHSVKKYQEVDANGEEVTAEYEDGWCFVPRKYDAIRFYVGYNKDRDMALVEVKDAHIDLFFDEETKEPLTYEFNGNEYYAAQVVYDLGKVIEKKVK